MYVQDPRFCQLENLNRKPKYVLSVSCTLRVGARISVWSRIGDFAGGWVMFEL